MAAPGLGLRSVFFTRHGVGPHRVFGFFMVLRDPLEGISGNMESHGLG